MLIEPLLQKNKPLASFCTYQIGGPADYFVEARNEEELLAALAWAEKEGVPVFVMGGGSNVLFDDAGFRGLVIRVKMNQLELHGEELWAEAGAMVAQVVKTAADAGLTGLEAWNGLPGTVGGAVYGNAGCFGVESKDLLKEARVWKEREIKTVKAADLHYDYRDSRLKHESAVVLSAIFQLKKGNPEAIAARMKEIAKSRIQKQPAGSSTGSFFKNPPGDHAGRLIEAAGLKGRTFGKARVSPEHANFFMNLGGATSADVLHLVQEVEATVFKKFGVLLEREVRVVAENPKK